MGLTDEERVALEAVCESVATCTVGGIDYHLLTGLRLPGSKPEKVEALLCMGERDGYPTRLYFAERVEPPRPYKLNWKGQTDRVLERNWHVFSWKVPQGLTPIETLHEHLKPFR